MTTCAGDACHDCGRKFQDIPGVLRLTCSAKSCQVVCCGMCARTTRGDIVGEAGREMGGGLDAAAGAASESPPCPRPFTLPRVLCVDHQRSQRIDCCDLQAGDPCITSIYAPCSAPGCIWHTVFVCVRNLEGGCGTPVCLLHQRSTDHPRPEHLDRRCNACADAILVRA